MKSYTSSVVGGGTGGKLCMDALMSSDRYKLVAACDTQRDVCRELKKNYPCIKTYASHHDMFVESPTDIVCISTWAPSHKEITLDALDLPLKGILVEKPLADSVKAGKELLNAVKAKNLPMCVPHGLLVARHSTEIIRRVHNGEIGDLKHVDIQCDKWDIINAGIHWLNFFILLTKNEQMEYVIAQCDKSSRTYRDGMQVETFAVTYAQTKSGVCAVMNTGDNVKVNHEGKDVLLRLIGTKGVIEFWAWESSYYMFNPLYPEGKLFKVPMSNKGNHQCHLEAMAGQIDTVKPDYTYPESSLMALELVEGAYISSKYGCKVDLPLSNFSIPEPVDWEPGQPYSGNDGGRNGRKLELHNLDM